MEVGHADQNMIVEHLTSVTSMLGVVAFGVQVSPSQSFFVRGESKTKVDQILTLGISRPDTGLDVEFFG